MRNIIYKSESIVPWDTQSAFKMTSYRTSCEENMVFCYLKCYVHHSDLVLCSYCFTENPDNHSGLGLFFNAAPDCTEKTLQIDYGYGGIKSAVINNCSADREVQFTSFKSDDEQGFYWCGELRLSAEFVYRHWGVTLTENSIFTLNMVQNFDNGDLSTLFGDVTENNFHPEDNMAAFVILNY